MLAVGGAWTPEPPGAAWLACCDKLRFSEGDCRPFSFLNAGGASRQNGKVSVQWQRFRRIIQIPPSIHPNTGRSITITMTAQMVNESSRNIVRVEQAARSVATSASSSAKLRPLRADVFVLHELLVALVVQFLHVEGRHECVPHFVNPLVNAGPRVIKMEVSL